VIVSRLNTGVTMPATSLHHAALVTTAKMQASRATALGVAAPEVVAAAIEEVRS
jgi:hypothetical protein